MAVFIKARNSGKGAQLFSGELTGSVSLVQTYCKGEGFFEKTGNCCDDLRAACVRGWSTCFAAAEHVLVFGHVQPTDHPYHLMAEKFKEELEAMSGGRVEVEIHPGGSLGNERDLVEGLKLGTVDVSTITSALTATFVREFGVFSLPFLFESFEQMYKVMDSPVGDEFAAHLEREGLVKLGFNSGGARSMYASKPVNSLEDLQKMKIRLWKIPFMWKHGITSALLPLPFPGETSTLPLIPVWLTVRKEQ